MLNLDGYTRLDLEQLRIRIANDDNTITVHVPKDWEMKSAIELATQISALYELKVNKEK